MFRLSLFDEFRHSGSRSESGIMLRGHVLTSLTAIFGSTPEKPDNSSDKLRDLYWNRAELKKEFANLREEQFRLQDRIKQKDGAAARLQQKIDHLENLLLNPEWVYNVIIHYQFRSLNQQCTSKLAKFAEQLKQQREKRMNNHLLVDWNGRRASEMAAVEKSIGEQRLQVQLFEDQLQYERHKLTSMSGLLKIFRRRSIAKNLENLTTSIESAQLQEHDLLLELDRIQSRPPPETKGLDIATKRLINYMILAFSQQLYLHYSENDLAGMAKEAGDKSVGAIKYGSKAECDKLLARIIRRVESYEKIADFADVLQQRAKLIADKALFRNDDDAVPVPGTVTTLFVIDAGGAVTRQEANLLGENYWGLSKVLSR